MNPFDAYIDQIMASVSVNSQEKQDLKEELLTHLTMLEKEYLIKGCGEAEAVTLAMERFGEANQLQKDFKDIRSPFNQRIKNISLICFAFYFPMIFLLTLSSSVQIFARSFCRGKGIKYCFSRLIEELSFIQLFGGTGIRVPCNLVPFKIFSEFFNILIYGGSVERSFCVLSIYLKKMILFVPLGLFLPILCARGKKLSGNILVTLIIGCIIEMLQYIWHKGVCDIDDVLFYVLGTVVGFIIYKIIRIFVKYKTT